MATILVIDDEEPIRSVLQAILSQAGHTVMDVSNGRAGVCAYDKNSQIDLVITDLLMPDQEGLETIQQLRRRSKAVKIVAMSGGGLYHLGHFLHVAKQLGADATLQKPFTRSELLDVIDELLAA